MVSSTSPAQIETSAEIMPAACRHDIGESLGRDLLKSVEAPSKLIVGGDLFNVAAVPNDLNCALNSDGSLPDV